MTTIQFTHRNLLLHFTLNEHKEVAQICIGTNKEQVNPMSRSFIDYKTLFKNKLGGLISKL